MQSGRARRCRSARRSGYGYGYANLLPESVVPYYLGSVNNEARYTFTRTRIGLRDLVIVLEYNAAAAAADGWEEGHGNAFGIPGVDFPPGGRRRRRMMARS